MSKHTDARPKIVRVMDKYGLDDLGDELADRWTKPQSTRQSCRELAEFFNIRVLDAALREEGILWERSLVEECAGIIKDKNKSLTGFDLDSRGVDTDEVGEDMVSYQSIHNYLTDDRGIEYEREINGIRSRVNSLQQMQARMETIATGIIAQSVAHNQINGIEPNVEITAKCICKACGSRTDMSQYLREEGCPTCNRSN
jgi:hypothetical protein